MNVLYVFAALIALALTGYLCVALLKPEWFELPPTIISR